MTAFELCGRYRDQRFKLKGGSVEWESISYRPEIDKCYISRVVESGGKPWFMGLCMQDRYISPDTEVIVIKPD